MKLPSKTDLDFVIHQHIEGDIDEYQLSIMGENDELQFWVFPRTGNMATISDKPNITRLFGELSEDTRDKGWLDYEGTYSLNEGDDKPTTGVYEIVEQGTVRMGKQTGDYSEMFLESDSLNDRWILRKIPNLFGETISKNKEITLLWKPIMQKSYNSAYDSASPLSEVACECPIKKFEGQFEEMAKEEGEETISKMTTDMLFDVETQTIEGIGMAEGTWIDMFGEKYVYTPELIIHTFRKQEAKLKRGEKISFNTEHPMDDDVEEGEITEIRLFQEPIYHIRVKGIYKGESLLSEDKFGLSYEFHLKSTWNEEFQAWVPFDATTDKISVVKRPSCKICWINKVN